MKTRRPTSLELDELLAFLPRLYAEGVTPIKARDGGEQPAVAIGLVHSPEYTAVVSEFFEVAARDCWSDPDYVPALTGRMLKDEAAVRSASLDELRSILTYCVRGERFSDGHWAEMVSGGHVRRVLERLAALRAQQG